MTKDEPNYMRELRQSMETHFSLTEIRTLAFDLDVDWGELEGPEKTLKIQSLILYLSRRERLKELMPLLKGARPTVDWESPPRVERRVSAEDHQAVLSSRTWPLAGIPFKDEKLIRPVVQALQQKHEEMNSAKLPLDYLVPKLSMLFDRATFRYEPLRECVYQNWNARFDKACQTMKVLRAYQINVQEEADELYPIYRELMEEVNGYCMFMGKFLFLEPGADPALIDPVIGMPEFNRFLPELVEFVTDQDGWPIIPDYINGPCEGHRKGAVKQMDRLVDAVKGT